MVLGELIISVILTIVSIGLYLATTQFKHVEGSLTTFGPNFWPRIILILLFVFSFIQTLMSIKKKKKISFAITKFSENKTLIFTLIIVALYIATMNILGFIISTLLFQIVFLMNLNVKKLSTITLVPVTMTVMLYLLFIKLMHTPLPRGIGIFRMFSLWFY